MIGIAHFCPIRQVMRALVKLPLTRQTQQGNNDNNLIEPLITRLWCETAAVLTLFVWRGQHWVSAGPICTVKCTSGCVGFSPTAAFAATWWFFSGCVSMNVVYFCFFQWPTILESSTPSWPKWPSLDGRDTTSCNWFEFRPCVNQSGGTSGCDLCVSASHAVKDEFEGVCLER